MTSLQLISEEPQKETRPPDWGTGRHGPYYTWIPRAPTWHTTGYPMGQQYEITSLKLSNTRDHDELVPKPEGVDLCKRTINLPFPAEHPFASHIEKFAFLPKFNPTDDPKRGLVAKQQKPISDEMPANNNHVIVAKKTKGFPYREENVMVPTEGQREALHWKGEDYFDQMPKFYGNNQEYYPAPPKLVAPNIQDRPPGLQVSERTQNVLRNIERNHWITTQKLDYTGLGPANPMVLDNLDCKEAIHAQTGVWNDKLYPHFINTFDPTRPLEGRLRKLLTPKPAQQMMIENAVLGESGPKRKMVLSEIEEDRLLNGRDYVNLPEGYGDSVKAVKWQDGYQLNKPASVLESHQMNKTEVPNECNMYNQSAKGKNNNFLDDMKIDQEKVVQGAVAQSRWKLLESHTPAHDIAELRNKYKILKSKELPATYYNHEGKYNEERAGLYKTSYDPGQLAYSMNARQLSGGMLFNTSMSHIDASLYPTITWDENEAALKGSRTIVFKNSELSGDRPSTCDVLLPYRETVAIQRHMLQPTVETAEPIVQEGKFILKDSTYGDSYNTKMFLQENKLDRNVRIEPRDIMSHLNQNLERAREVSAPIGAPLCPGQLKAVHFSEDVNIRNIHQNMPLKFEESHIRNLSSAEKAELDRAFEHGKTTSLTYTITHPERPHSDAIVIGEKRNLAENLLNPPMVPTVIARNVHPIIKPPFVSFTRDPQNKPVPISETADQFRSLSTNFMPVGLKHEPGMKSTYSCQFPAFDLSEKHDARFNWEPGTGQPRPQSCLQELQDSFVKSEFHKRLHRMFPDPSADLRANFTAGKKHKFINLSSQPIHG